MVFSKIKKAFSANDEKYEALYYRYSQIKNENAKLKKKHKEDLEKFKETLNKKIALELVTIYGHANQTKQDSFKIRSTDREVQQLMMDINKTNKSLNDLMQKMEVESFSVKDLPFNPDMHEAVNYEINTGMNKGMIIKTIKKGFKYKGQVLKKARVTVSK